MLRAMVVCYVHLATNSGTPFDFDGLSCDFFGDLLVSRSELSFRMQEYIHPKALCFKRDI